METQKNKKPLYKKVWFWIVILIILYSIGSSQSTKIENTKGTQSNSQTKTEETKVEAIKVTAIKLSEDYKANEVSADAQYKGKLVEITGLVDSIGKDITDTPYVVLQTSQYAIVDRIQCMFSKSDSDIQELSKVVKNQKITLGGKASGKLGNVLISDCKIVK